MKKYSQIEKIKLINSYFERYGDSYTKNQVELIKESFGKSNNDYMTQIYHALNMLEENENPYIGITEIIEKTFGLDINILEIGGGVYPALSECISRRQMQIKKGTIAVYDPYLSRGLDLKHISLNKEEFTGNVNDKKVDLVVGKDPCAATFKLISYSETKNKDLVLSPCNCYTLLPDCYDFMIDPVKEWYDYVKNTINRSKGELKTHYLNPEYNYANPIYVKKREHQN